MKVSRTRGRLLWLAAIIPLTACDFTRSIAPSGLHNGSVINASGTQSVSLPGLDGKLVTTTLRDWAVQAIISDGMAESTPTAQTSAKRNLIAVPGSLQQSENVPGGVSADFPIIAVLDDHPLATGRTGGMEIQTIPMKDGTQNTFVSVIGNKGGPPKQVFHLKNRKVVSVYKFGWKKVDGGWLATSFGVAVFNNGHVIAQFKSEARPAVVADAVFANQRIQAMKFLANAFLPAVAIAQSTGIAPSKPRLDDPSPAQCDNVSLEGGPCDAQLQDYLAAATASASATQVATNTGTLLDPWVAIGLGAAWIYVGILLQRYHTCVREHRLAIGYSEGSYGTGGEESVGITFVDLNDAEIYGAPTWGEDQAWLGEILDSVWADCQSKSADVCYYTVVAAET